MIPAPASLLWFARHELRLNWRDTIAMLSGGHRVRLLGFALGGIAVYAVIALIAWFAVRPWLDAGAVVDKSTLMLVSGMGFLFWIVTLSQALEAVTRVYYSRSDLDLILSSPASSRRLFAVRAGGVAVSTALLGMALISPLVIVLVVQDGPQWFAAFLVLAALACLSTTLAMLVTLLLFHAVGPKKTRLIAQILAAIIGAGFAIGIQGVAILSHEGFSRLALFQSAEWIDAAPSLDSLLWLPARAVMGDIGAAGTALVAGLALLAITTLLTAPSYGRLATAAAGLSHVRSQRRRRGAGFAPISQRQALRRKEWRLLQRDPWLLSQTLMQLLYLLPPALLLWVNYGGGDGNFVVAVPVLVMAAGQLAGGLAWLAISGEDAHDLVATAPLLPSTILRAKVEAVLAVIAIVLAPILLLILVMSWRMALITALFAGLAAAASTAIQLWFRVTAKRSMFRRRQVASRAATLSEAFSSIMWAGSGALLAAGSPIAILPALVAIAVLGLARLIAPKSN
ncbi:permease [Devosia sp. 63-57]|uniref:permease n=1 Tax=Devosia sp. 63-57 TaxID=1895751 RepID=UPI000AA7C8CF|nr:permease [Devosia sp. 63-57]